MKIELYVDRKWLGCQDRHWRLLLRSTLKIAHYVQISRLLSCIVLSSKVDIGNLVYKVDIAKIMNVNLNTQAIFCQP